MKRASIFIIVVLLTIKVYSQNEYVYKNAEFGVEVTFPSKPVEDIVHTTIINQVNATSNLLFTAGLSYQIVIQKATVKVDMAKVYRETYKIKSEINYKVGEKEVTEMEMELSGTCSRMKILNIKKTLIVLTVSGQSCAQDKDVFPFYNSLKIDGLLIQNPNTDNNKFKTFAIEYPLKNKTDTVKQIIYVNSGSKPEYQYENLSDVDKNIPQNSTTSPYRFALIIGNEDYSSHQTDLKSESNVDFARNDASAFKVYCMNMMGIPEKNITFLLDATVGQISQGISLLKMLSKASGGKSQLIVFYAGHGLPDEKTKEPYLIPVDVNGSNVTAGIKLQDMYNSLTEFPSDRVMVFLDACFTGGGRNAGLVESRGVKIMPKKDVLNGNIVVFSSSSGEQSSLPYSEQKHGMFTYYLLKKLQETKGDVTYSDLSEYLDEKVSIESLLVNKKEQNPVVNTSQVVTGTWKLWKVK